MTGRAHPGVDDHIARLPDWQQSICEQLRELTWDTSTCSSTTLTAPARGSLV